MLATIAVLNHIEMSEVAAVVGSRSFERGRTFANYNRVKSIKWGEADQTLLGKVMGKSGIYEARAYFLAADDGVLSFDGGKCTCPVGYNCKHVAALVIVAARGNTKQSSDVAREPRQVAARAAQPSSWETPLRVLIDTPALAAEDVGISLAIELALRSDFTGRGEPRLGARLMRPGARGGWVHGTLSWLRLDTWHVQNNEYRPDHLALVRELYAMYQARRQRAADYGYGFDKILDLSDCDSSQLWSLLDEAMRIGLPLVHAQQALGQLRPYQRGELLLDVTRREDEGSMLSTVFRTDEDGAEDLQPLSFIGLNGHGVVCAERAEMSSGQGIESLRLRLVRLAKPTAPQLQRMAIGGERLDIPSEQLRRFTEEMYPALRNVAAIVSSDGSFTPPEMSAPSLVLRASHGANHLVDVAWEWAYQVGETDRQAPLGPAVDGPGFRDLAAERAVLADTALALAETDLARYGLLDGAGRPMDAPVSLTGMDSMRLVTEELPRLAQLPDVAVEVSGEAPDYRDVGQSVTIGVSTADIAGDRDWFDLGVTINIEGRELPFSEVFVALASGESNMLLDDGAHFSLLEPRLQALRQMIEEARALGDPAATSLRISRYQAGLWAELSALGVVTEQGPGVAAPG